MKAAGEAAIIPLRYGLKVEPHRPRVNALDVKSASIQTTVRADKARLMMSIDSAIGGAQTMNLDMKKLFSFLKDSDPAVMDPVVTSVNAGDLTV